MNARQSALLASVCLGLAGVVAAHDQLVTPLAPDPLDGPPADTFAGASPVVDEDDQASGGVGGILGLMRKYESWFYSLSASVIIGLTGIFPLLVIPIQAGQSLHHPRAARTLRLLLSFAVGGLLGDVFLHLLPEAWDHLEKDRQEGESINHMYIGLWVLAGIFTFIVLEMLFTSERQEQDKQVAQQASKPKTELLGHKSSNGSAEIHGKTPQVTGSSSSTRNRVSSSRKTLHDKHNGYTNGHCHSHCDHDPASSADLQTSSKQITGYLNLLANSIDNFTHGLAVAGSFLVSKKVGILTTFAILVHEIPHEIGDFAILLKSGFNRWEAAKAQVITATVGLLGAITALSVESTQTLGDKTVWILPFTAGGFLNIALVNVLPDLLKEKDLRESMKLLLCLLTGVTVMAGVTFLCE